MKDSGVFQIACKPDQEAATTKMIELAIRAAGRCGTPAVDRDLEQHRSNLDQAVNELSAIGESASNNRAERTVQAVADMLRTSKSALEARLRVRIPSTHQIMRWLVEHVATILNRYSVVKDGATPYFAFHGKRPDDRLVEFGKKVFYCIPRKARAKLEHQWKLGFPWVSLPTLMSPMFRP